MGLFPSSGERRKMPTLLGSELTSITGPEDEQPVVQFFGPPPLPVQQIVASIQELGLTINIHKPTLTPRPTLIY
jgi:hypothetical protein